jgi:hypothetical protein
VRTSDLLHIFLVNVEVKSIVRKTLRPAMTYFWKGKYCGYSFFYPYFPKFSEAQILHGVTVVILGTQGFSLS